MTTEIEYAQLSLAVYSTKRDYNTIDLPTGWELAAPDSLHPDNLGGFSYGVFRRTGTTEIVVAYTGSNEKMVVDYAGTNLPAGVGLPAIQVTSAALAYEQAVRAYGSDSAGSNITFTGHSLGGGLASVMAIWYNHPAVVFDEAPFQLTAANPALLVLVRATLLANGYTNTAMDAALSDFTLREQQVKNYYLSDVIITDSGSDFIDAGGGDDFIFTGGGGFLVDPSTNAMLDVQTLLANGWSFHKGMGSWGTYNDSADNDLGYRLQTFGVSYWRDLGSWSGALGASRSEVSEADVVWAGAGNDRVLAGVGNDLVFLGEGNDAAEGYLGDDEIFGGDGNDFMMGDDFYVTSSLVSAKEKAHA